MALTIAIIRILLVAISIFLGIFCLPDIARSIDIILLLAVAVIGILSFFSHVVFHKLMPNVLDGKQRILTGSLRWDSQTLQ